MHFEFRTSLNHHYTNNNNKKKFELDRVNDVDQNSDDAIRKFEV